MPEAEAPQQEPKAETEASPESRAARSTDTRIVTESIFRRLVPENASEDYLTKDPAANAVASSEVFGNITKDQIGKGVKFPGGEEPGEAKMDGNPLFLDEDTQVLSIVENQAEGVDDSDTIRCEVQVGKGATAMREERDISRQAIRNANLVAERDTILAGFSDEDQEVVAAYIDSLDSTKKPEDKKVASDKAIIAVAQRHSMMTMEDTQKSADLVASGDTGIQDKLKDLDGRLVLADDEFLDLGMSNGDINDKMTEIHKAKLKLDEKILKDGDEGFDEHYNDEDQVTARRDRNEANDQYALLAKARRTEERARAAKAGSPPPVEDVTRTTDFDVDVPERRGGDDPGQVINEQINRFTAAMRDTPENQRGSKDYLEQRQMLANLRMAQEATGPYGAIIQQQVLEQIRDKSSTTQIGVERVLRSQEFKDQVTQAQKELGEFYDRKGFSAEDKKMMGEAMADPQKFESLIENDKFAQASQEMMRGFFGADLEDTQIDTIMQNLTDANNDLLDTRMRHKIAEFFTTNKRKKLTIVAIILASLPVAAAALSAAAALGTVGLAGGMGKR